MTTQQYMWSTEDKFVQIRVPSSIHSWIYDRVCARAAVYHMHNPDLYKCNHCGTRLQGSQIDKHLDEHFHKRRQRAGQKHRVYFGSIIEWTKSAAIASTSHQEQEIPTIQKEDDNYKCPVCEDVFELKYDSDEQDWIFLNTVRSGKHVVHRACERFLN